MKSEFENDILIGDLNLDWQQIATEIGIENTIKLCKLMGGELLYVPTYEKIIITESLHNNNICDTNN